MSQSLLWSSLKILPFCIIVSRILQHNLNIEYFPLIFNKHEAISKKKKLRKASLSTKAPFSAASDVVREIFTVFFIISFPPFQCFLFSMLMFKSNPPPQLLPATLLLKRIVNAQHYIAAVELRIYAARRTNFQVSMETFWVSRIETRMEVERVKLY